MKVLLVSEGKHEQSGALESLIKRMAQRQIVCESERVHDSKIHAYQGKGGGYFKKAVRWIITAQERGYDALILLCDRCLEGFAPFAYRVRSIL
jgi:hypothetical protein